LTGIKREFKTQDLSLEAFKNGNLVQIFASEDKLNSLRAAKIAKSLFKLYLKRCWKRIPKNRGNQKTRLNS
jgi:hypothetical protein